MNEDGMDFEFTQLACDEDARRILSLTNGRSFTIKEISDILCIPISRCYRRINEMASKGMLISPGLDENRASLYQSNLKSFYITLENYSLCVHVEYEDGGQEDFNYNASPTVADA